MTGHTGCIVDETDPTQTRTIEWVDAHLPSLNALCNVTHSVHGAIEAWRCEVPQDKRDEVAARLAIGIAARRLAVKPNLFSAWFDLAANEPVQVENEQLERIRRYGLLVDVGTPEDPATDIRFYGLLAESVLHELLDTVDHGLGHPILIEGHDWSVLDPGGDKLVVYETESGLVFRLWESKALSSMERTATTVVGEAAKQLEDRSADYIARFAVTACRSVDDENLAAFIADLPDLWADAHDCAGVGVSVTTHDCGETTCFSQLGAHFNLPDAHKAGHLTLLGPLNEYRTTVSQLLWKGAGLWNVH